MVNYKIVNEQTVPVNTSFGEYAHMHVERGGDILELMTDQIVRRGLSRPKAKEVVRHLNFGGGFDGHTPAFFLAEREKF
jgi:hypothetical protein